MKHARIFSILTFIALAMVSCEERSNQFLATTPSGLAAIDKVLSLDGDGDYKEDAGD